MTDDGDPGGRHRDAPWRSPWRCCCSASARSSIFDSHRLGARWGERRPAVRLLPVLHRTLLGICVSRRVRGSSAAGAASARRELERRRLRRVGERSSWCCRCCCPTLVYVLGDPAHRHLRRVGDLHRAVHARGSGKYRWLRRASASASPSAHRLRDVRGLVPGSAVQGRRSTRSRYWATEQRGR